MIRVYESTGEIPEDIARCGPGAPAYLVIDPSKGTALSRAEVEREIRAGYRKGSSILFGDEHTLDDGRIVHVGEKTAAIFPPNFP